MPGMLHGRVVRPTGIRSKLIGIGSFDPPVDGAQVVTKGDFVGVVADERVGCDPRPDRAPGRLVRVERAA